MKKAILVLFMAIAMVGQSQVVVTLVKKQQTEQSLTATSTKTKYLYNDLPVWMSVNGKYFIVKQAKSGNFYKVYVEVKQS
jgi:maltose-binding protein MalE